jgi:peptide subunit release factor RF-3
MAVRQPRYSKEEFTQRGNALYESQIRLQVEPTYPNKIVANKIETGEFEIGDDNLSAADRLFQRIPDAQPWCVRIGTGPVHRLGFHSPGEAP